MQLAGADKSLLLILCVSLSLTHTQANYILAIPVFSILAPQLSEDAAPREEIKKKKRELANIQRV